MSAVLCCPVVSVRYQFWEVVPVEDLLVRMELDSAPVAKRITSLLLDSFQPLDKGKQERVRSSSGRGALVLGLLPVCWSFCVSVPLPSAWYVVGTLHCSDTL